MIGTFIKLYDWTADLNLDIYERIVFCLILQFSEKRGKGFYAGYKELADRTTIPKSKCKEIVAKLIALGLVQQFHATIGGKTRIIFRAPSKINISK